MRSNTARLKQWHQAYNGKRCFIMGNGPSLNHTPLEKLKGEVVWGLNRCYLLFDRIDWRPTFFTAVDDRVVPDIALELIRIMTENPEMLCFFPEIFLYSRIIPSRPNIIWFRQRGMNPKDTPNGYFSLSARDYVRSTNTVTITAMQLAVYMGFNPIILIGCDTRFRIPDDVVRQGETVDPGTRETISGYDIISRSDNDPNHFDPNYFGTGKKWHAPNVSGMLFGYSQAKKVCDASGVVVLNATIGGDLELFPRIPFLSLFK